jgi:hypothetical protein
VTEMTHSRPNGVFTPRMRWLRVNYELVRVKLPPRQSTRIVTRRSTAY